MQVVLFILLLIVTLLDILSNSRYATEDFYSILSQNYLVDELGRKTYKRFIWFLWAIINLVIALIVVCFMLMSKSFPNIDIQLQRIFISMLVVCLCSFIVEIPAIHLAINMKPSLHFFQAYKWIDLVLAICNDCLLLTAIAFIINAWIKGCA